MLAGSLFGDPRALGLDAAKAAGPIVAGGHSMPDRLAAVVALVAPALLAALVVYETLAASDRGVEPDARLAGIALAAVAVALRAPLLVTVTVAAAARPPPAP